MCKFLTVFLYNIITVILLYYILLVELLKHSINNSHMLLIFIAKYAPDHMNVK